MDVVVVGSCMIDLVSYTPRQPCPGETVQGTSFKKGFGGKGANQCCQAAKLGAKTSMVAVLGNDVFADNTLENFKNLEINSDNIRKEETGSSGVATITVSEDGQNSIVVIPGANLCMREEDIIKARDMIMGSKVVVCQLEVPPHISFVTLRMARNSGVFTILNTAPVWEDMNPEIFSYCDIVCANEIEAGQLAKMEVNDVETAKTAAKLLLAKGSKCVIITLGSKGCVLTSAEYDGIHVPAESVRVTDTTGAGDSFVGALAYFKALLPSLSLLEIVHRASVIAARSVENSGTQSSFPSAGQLPAEVMSIQEKP